MLSAKLGRWLILAVMIMLGTLRPGEGYSLDNRSFERQLREPFNDMKMFPFKLNMHEMVR